MTMEADDAIALAQCILEAHDQGGPGTHLIGALDEIVSTNAWRDRKSSAGSLYESFGKFVTDQKPHGLGVNNLASFNLITFALRQNRHFGALTDLVEHCAREPGRPPNIIVGDERFHAVVSRSCNSIGRILISLKRHHPQAFAEVCNRSLTPREAARQVGLLSEKGRQKFGVCDFEAAQMLPAQAQAKLIVKLFQSLCIDAQCALLSRSMEPTLGPDLAQRWRQSKIHSK
jgi:hypothetical protein